MKKILIFSIIFLFFSFKVSKSVPFVTKRVSLHNPIAIDFSGWKPLSHHSKEQQLKPNSGFDLQMSSSEQQLIKQEIPLEKQFLTVPVAIETDAEHILSDKELSQIREHVIENWRQKPIKSESFPHLRPFVTQLLPKPEVEVTKNEESSEDNTQNDNNDNNNDDNSQRSDPEEYTFVKMESKSGSNVGSNSSSSSSGSSDENLFHAYFASRDHVPPEGYIRLTKEEFQKVFKNAEILFV